MKYDCVHPQCGWRWWGSTWNCNDTLRTCGFWLGHRWWWFSGFWPVCHPQLTFNPPVLPFIHESQTYMQRIRVIMWNTKKHGFTNITDSALAGSTSQFSYWPANIGMTGPQHWQPPQNPQLAAGIWQYCGVWKRGKKGGVKRGGGGAEKGEIEWYHHDYHMLLPDRQKQTLVTPPLFFTSHRHHHYHMLSLSLVIIIIFIIAVIIHTTSWLSIEPVGYR